MTEIYIVRHGQTNSNIRSAYLGHTDVELNSQGIEQAKQLSEKLASVRFDEIYTSPLARAVKTAEIIAQRQNLLVKMNYGLTERDYGEWDNLTFEEISAKAPDECQAWLENWIDYAVPGGESARQAHNRIAETVDRIITKNPDKRIVLVSHLGVIRHMIAHLLGMEAEDAWKFTVDNCSVSVIRSDNGKILVMGLNNKL